jgi:hypothetical protein
LPFGEKLSELPASAMVWGRWGVLWWLLWSAAQQWSKRKLYLKPAQTSTGKPAKTVSKVCLPQYMVLLSIFRPQTYMRKEEEEVS